MSITSHDEKEVTTVIKKGKVFPLRFLHTDDNVVKMIPIHTDLQIN